VGLMLGPMRGRFVQTRLGGSSPIEPASQDRPESRQPPDDPSRWRPVAEQSIAFAGGSLAAPELPAATKPVVDEEIEGVTTAEAYDDAEFEDAADDAEVEDAAEEELEDDEVEDAEVEDAAEEELEEDEDEEDKDTEEELEDDEEEDAEVEDAAEDELEEDEEDAEVEDTAEDELEEDEDEEDEDEEDEDDAEVEDAEEELEEDEDEEDEEEDAAEEASRDRSSSRLVTRDEIRDLLAPAEETTDEVAHEESVPLSEFVVDSEERDEWVEDDAETVWR